MKHVLKSKTVRVFGLVGIIAVALIAENLFGLDLGTGIELREAVGAAVGSVIVLGLRWVTNEGVTF